MDTLFLPRHTRSLIRVPWTWPAGQGAPGSVALATGGGIGAGGRVLRHVDRYTQRKKSRTFTENRTFPTPSPRGR